MVVDLIRRPYRTLVLFSPGTNPVPVRWYWTLPGAKLMPCRTTFGSGVWSDKGGPPYTGVGSETGLTFIDGNRPPRQPGLAFLGPPAWFQQGIPQGLLPLLRFPAIAGGAITAGVTTVVYGHHPLVLGGSAAGGFASVLYRQQQTCYGGQADAGQAGSSRGMLATAYGGQADAGLSGSSRGMLATAYGGQADAGLSGTTYAMTATASGGQKDAGDPSVTFTPGSPSPGADCSTAPTVTLGTSYTWTATSGHDYWWHFVPPTGDYYHATWTISGGRTASWEVAQECPPVTTVGSGSVSGCEGFFISSPDDMYMHVHAVSGACTITMTIAEGTC